MTTSLLMATVLPPGASEELGEAEPVIVHVDPLVVTLTLESGERLVLDRSELQTLLAGQPAVREAA